MNWRELYFGYVKASEVQKAIKDSEWQRLRKEMKGRALEDLNPNLNVQAKRNVSWKFE